MHGLSKVIIGTGWDFSQQTVERVMVGTSCSLCVVVFMREASSPMISLQF